MKKLEEIKCFKETLNDNATMMNEMKHEIDQSVQKVNTFMEDEVFEKVKDNYNHIYQEIMQYRNENLT